MNSEAANAVAPGSPANGAVGPGSGPKSASDNLVGAAWILASGLAATALYVAVETLSQTLSTQMIAFLRTLLGLWVLAPMAFSGVLWRLRLTRPWLHLARGVLMGAALNLGFFALANLPLATATILFFLAPIFVTALAGLLFRESVGPWRWGAVGVGFIGALVILQPGAAPVNVAMLAAMLCAACFSVALLLSRVIAREDGAQAVMATSTAVAAVVCLPVALPVWRMPDTQVEWLWVAVLVAASSLRMYADIQAYAKGEAGFVAPFSYMRLLFVAAAGWWVFNQAPEPNALIGGAVIVAAALVIAYREAQIRRAAAPPS
ncbi:MAG: DMT family transporter [Pseudomonadota bacterium]